jgi:hypothetical protein
MQSLIKRIKNSNLIINLRNVLNIKPVHMSVNNLNNISVSDAFLWRTDNKFITKFKYADILNIFYKTKNSWVEFHFYTKNNQLLKIEKKNNLSISNEIEINKKYLNNLEDYGVFYIYHYSSDKIEEENIISNRCYLGYSQNNNLFSFVHGNTLAKFTKISNDKKIFSNIVRTSLLKNQYYKIQKYFGGYDKNELLFSNPTSKTVKFTIDEKDYKLNEHCSRLVNVSNKEIINIKSNCLFLRPTVFSYKDNYLDVHHS